MYWISGAFRAVRRAPPFSSVIGPFSTAFPPVPTAFPDDVPSPRPAPGSAFAMTIFPREGVISRRDLGAAGEGGSEGAGGGGAGWRGRSPPRGSRSGRLRRGALDDSRLRPREVDGSRQVGQVHDHHVRGPKRGEGNQRRQHQYRQMEQDGEGDPVFQQLTVRHKFLLYQTIVPTFQFVEHPLP